MENLTVSHLSTLVAEVLNNSRYRDNAREFQQAIAKTNGLSRAAELLEEAFGLTKEASAVRNRRSYTENKITAKLAK